MAYIGREAQVGNFQVCDAISVVNGQAAYTMQVGGVNVVPETAFHMLVSLNGVLQKPGSSFTVSSSTITFASNLATGDVIDFIHILGSVLDLGVPSDSTVSLAKLTATGTKDATTFLRGDNTFASAGEANTPAFSAKTSAATTANANTATKVNYASEHFDSDGKYDTSTSRFTPTIAGKYFIMARFRLSETADLTGLKISIYKNGGAASRHHQQSNFHNETVQIAGIIDLDTDDYVEIYFSHNHSGTSSTVNDDSYSTFEGFRIIT